MTTRVRIRDVEPLHDYTLRIGFSDGSFRDVDLEPELWGPMFEPLRDPEEFRKVAVALTKAREFLAEAQACAGEAGVERGDASSTVTDNNDNDIDADVDIPDILDPPGDAGGTPQ